jgi:hypothetical protein
MDHTKPGSPGDILEHHGVKGMRWGVRKKEDTTEDDDLARETAQRNDKEKQKLVPGTPEFQQRIEKITRTDQQQVIGAQRIETPREGGLTRNQKIALTFGAAGAAAAGYYAYTRYTGSKMPGLDPSKILQEEQTLAGLKLPASWDVSGLRTGPISTRRLGDLAGGEFNAKLHDIDDLVINTSRGYADILPKDGFDNPFAAAQHASVTRVLEEMRDKYPAIRNLNVEVVPQSKVPGLEDSSAFMSVMSMRAGEARVIYNDLMDAPTKEIIEANRDFLPGIGKKDYIAYHEMGHLLAVAHGELPPTFDLLTGAATPAAWRRWETAEPLLHKRMFAKHGFTFSELSKLSEYAATQPAEAMAELVGHYLQPDMRSRLTKSQLKRAEAMINEMGGLSG